VISRALADLVVISHLAFILFVVAGGLLALRWRWIPFLHLPAAVWGVYIELSGGVCPLTPLENTLRHEAGLLGYSGSFIEHYLVPVIYPAGLTQPLQWVLAGVVVLANAFVYTLIWRKHRGARQA
jgi:hypothetical protein